MNRSFNLLFYVRRSKANAEGLATFTCVLLPLGTLDWRRGGNITGISKLPPETVIFQGAKRAQERI
jgi:hypothetical protein